MLFQELIDRFAQGTPLTVMTRAVLEHTLDPEPLNQLFEKEAQTQYTRDLLFSQVIAVMGLVVCGFYSSPHAVYRKRKDLFPVTLKCFYEKLNGIELPLMQAMLRDNVKRLTAILQEMGGTVPPLLPGYRVKILDGNCLAGTDHRLKILRETASAALPGKSLVVLDPQLGLAIDVFLCEDGHAQERSLLGEVLLTVAAGDLWIEDRNFCTRDWLHGVANRQAFVLVREHAGLPWTAMDALRRVGRTETGEVWEQQVKVLNEAEEELLLRRIVIHLDEPTRDGETTVVLLSNVLATVDALTLARLYLARWKIENLFLVLTETLHCEQKRLGYPKAALFSFTIALLAYNVLAIVKGALRVVYGVKQVEEKVSLFHLTEEVRRNYSGMMIALPAEQWLDYRTMGVAELVKHLLAWARNVNLPEIAKAPSRPKKAKKKPKYDPQTPHVSTAKLLAGT